MLTVSKEFTKKFGDVVKTASHVIEKSKDLKRLKTVPKLDLALGGGIEEGGWTLITGMPKTGKCQPLSSLVYTPDGPVRMGDIAVGAVVCTPDGGTAKVLEIFPQGEKAVFEVIFNDGTSARSSIDHIWRVAKNDRNKSTYVNMTLEEIIQSGLTHVGDRNKWKVQLTKPVSFNKREDIVLDPYILGCLIGDGGLTNVTPIISSMDEELLDTFREYCNKNGLVLRKRGPCGYSISTGIQFSGNNVLSNELRVLGLMGKGSHDKFIPAMYKYSSVDDRLDIIRGLMDTDGYNQGGRGAEYSTVSKQLAKDMMEVLQSVGYTANIKFRHTKCNGKKFPSYRLQVCGNDISNLFSLTRKKFDHKRSKPDLCRTITEIKSVGSEECKCILIDHPDHLYLTDNLVVTHNTTVALHIVLNAVKEGRPIIYVDAEGRLKRKQLGGIRELDQHLDQIHKITPPDNESWSAEKFLTAAEMLIKDPANKGCVCVIDSVSALIPQAELDAEVSSTIRASLPKMLSHWMKKMNHVVPHQRATMILIRHFIADTGPSRKTKIADGGNKIQYQADTILDVTYTQAWKEGSGDLEDQVGHIINWDVVCSSLGPSGRSAQSWLRYGTGIDIVQENLILGEELGLIAKAGAWYTAEFMENHLPEGKDWEPKDFKRQGSAKFRDLFVENPDMMRFLEEDIAGIMC